LKGARKSVRDILSPQFMGDLICVEIEEEGLPWVSYRVDHQALRRLTEERLGKTVLVTDRLEWSPSETVEAYRNLTCVEDAFKNMKNVDFQPRLPLDGPEDTSTRFLLRSRSPAIHPDRKGGKGSRHRPVTPSPAQGSLGDQGGRGHLPAGNPRPPQGPYDA
jgi:hypothetical protein